MKIKTIYKLTYTLYDGNETVSTYDVGLFDKETKAFEASELIKESFMIDRDFQGCKIEKLQLFTFDDEEN